MKASNLVQKLSMLIDKYGDHEVELVSATTEELEPVFGIAVSEDENETVMNFIICDEELLITFMEEEEDGE